MTIVLSNTLILILAGLYIARKTGKLVRVLKSGKQETQKGSLKGVIRCLLGLGRTFNRYDMGLFYMSLIVLGILSICIQISSRLFTLNWVCLSMLSGFLAIFIAGLCCLFILLSLIQRFRVGYSMELLPLIALLALPLVQSVDYFSIAGQWVDIGSFYMIVFFVAASFPHALASILNIYYQKRTPIGKITTISLTDETCGAATVWDLPWKSLLDSEACANCGRCERNCLAFISGKPLSPRKIVRDILQQTDSKLHPKDSAETKNPLTREDIWSCTLCMACVTNCPVYVDHVDIIIDQRRLQVLGRGDVPSATHKMLRNLETFGDIMGNGVANRSEWSMNRNINQLSVKNNQTEMLLWAGCSGSFHPGFRKTIQAMAVILKAGGINFKILGNQELCCGDPARRLGKEDLFQELAKENIKRLSQYQIKEIVTLCPHCFHTLKNEYTDLGGDFKVKHASEVIAKLIHDERIWMKYPLTEKQLAIHDPCYLGRTNGVYQPIRDICQAVPEARLHEFPRNKDQAICCGGGGGQMWLHQNQGQNINQIRTQEIFASNTDIVVTACPYCLTMLEDGLNGLETETVPKILDLVDIVALSLA